MLNEGDNSARHPRPAVLLSVHHECAAPDVLRPPVAGTRGVRPAPDFTLRDGRPQDIAGRTLMVHAEKRLLVHIYWSYWMYVLDTFYPHK